MPGGVRGTSKARAGAWRTTSAVVEALGQKCLGLGARSPAETELGTWLTAWRLVFEFSPVLNSAFVESSFRKTCTWRFMGSYKWGYK